MMARKGFWKRLFGGGEEPEKGKPPEDRTPESDPARWHEDDTTPPAEPSGETEDQADATHDVPRDSEAVNNADETGDEPAREDDSTTTRPDEQGGEQDADDDLEINDAEADPASGPEAPSPAPGSEAPQPPANSETILPQTAELKTDAVGRVYAQSLIELAQDAGQQDAIAEEVAGLLPLVEPGGDLYLLVTNPAISTDERSKIVSRVFEGKVSDLLYRFLQVVTSKNRLGSLNTILGGYLLLVSEARGLVDVDAYVATAMDQDTAARVAEQIGQSLGKQVTLRQHVDESLIGGLKIKVGDKLIDASVASQLRSMQQKMIAARR